MTFKILFSASTMAGMAVASSCPKATAFITRKNMISNLHKGRTKTMTFGSFEEGMGTYKYYDGDHFDMKELKERIDHFANPFHGVFGYVWGRPKPNDVYVILFNPGTEKEGVHTVEYPRGSGNNVIMAFESKAECQKFSNVLEDQQFYEPFAQEVNLDFLETYCKSLGVFVQVVPEGMDIRLAKHVPLLNAFILAQLQSDSLLLLCLLHRPPTETVEILGNDPSLMEQQHFLDHIFYIGDENEIEDCGTVLTGAFDTNWG
mmetsp:Transcript_27827/g.81669  ORF Transcript_27827/g.81669 Transcript_27827/m.81669 type:complete len:260 (-) Transcript_27827:448-1227(-)